MASVTVWTLRASISLRVTTLTDCGFSRMEVSVLAPVALRPATQPGAGPQASSIGWLPVTVTASRVETGPGAGLTTSAPCLSSATRPVPASRVRRASMALMRPDSGAARLPAAALASTRMGVPVCCASAFSDCDSSPAGSLTSATPPWAAAVMPAAPRAIADSPRRRAWRVARKGAWRGLRSIMVSPRKGSEQENERVAFYRTIIFGPGAGPARGRRQAPRPRRAGRRAAPPGIARDPVPGNFP